MGYAKEMFGHIEDEAFEFDSFSVHYKAYVSGTHVHESPVFYYKDGTGDPGYDEIDDITVDDIEIVEVYDKDDNCVKLSEEQMKALYNAIDDELSTLDEDDFEWSD